VFTYDTLGRVTKALQLNGGYTLTGYQGLTTVATVHVIPTNAAAFSEVTTTTKNDLGQPASVTDARGGVTSFTYDAPS